MNVPSWWGALLLFTAAWRTFHLLAHDDILDRPRRYITRTPKSWKEGDPSPSGVRYGLAEFLECPFCLGAWCAIGWWGAWLVSSHWTLVVAVPFALSAGVVAAHKFLSSD